MISLDYKKTICLYEMNTYYNYQSFNNTNICIQFFFSLFYCTCMYNLCIFNILYLIHIHIQNMYLIFCKIFIKLSYSLKFILYENINVPHMNIDSINLLDFIDIKFSEAFPKNIENFIFYMYITLLYVIYYHEFSNVVNLYFIFSKKFILYIQYFIHISIIC